MIRSRWEDLPEDIRHVISCNAGGLISAEPVSAGSAEIALVLSTESAARIFVKGVRGDRAKIEVRVQPFLPEIAPQLRWHANVGEYLLMAFDYVEGRPAVLSPGSHDLPAIASALSELSQTAHPDLPVLPAEKRWAPFAEDPAILVSIAGNSLVHADLTADNFIIGQRLRIVDWAWPSKGADWLDAVSMIVRLIQAGHSPQQAEEWAQNIPAWRTATREDVTAYARLRAALARTTSAPVLSSWESYLIWLHS